MRASVWPVIFAVVLLNACSSSSFAPTPSAAVRPAYDGEVKILRSYPAEGTYEHLGIVSVTGRSLAEENDLIELMVDVAAERGANCLMTSASGMPTHGMTIDHASTQRSR